MLRNRNRSFCGKSECIAQVKFFNGALRFFTTLVKMEGFRVVEGPSLDKSAVLGHQSVRCLESFVQIVLRPACSAFYEIEDPIRNHRNR